jgi:hypothetical protein
MCAGWCRPDDSAGGSLFWPDRQLLTARSRLPVGARRGAVVSGAGPGHLQRRVIEFRITRRLSYHRTLYEPALRIHAHAHLHRSHSGGRGRRLMGRGRHHAGRHHVRDGRCRGRRGRSRGRRRLGRPLRRYSRPPPCRLLPGAHRRSLSEAGRRSESELQHTADCRCVERRRSGGRADGRPRGHSSRADQEDDHGDRCILEAGGAQVRTAADRIEPQREACGQGVVG